MLFTLPSRDNTDLDWGDLAEKVAPGPVGGISRGFGGQEREGIPAMGWAGTKKGRTAAQVVTGWLGVAGMQWWEKQEMTGWMEGPTQELMNSLAVPKGSGIPQESDRNLGGQNDI